MQKQLGEDQWILEINNYVFVSKIDTEQEIPKE